MTRAVILTTQRSGSTFLEDVLERHPEVKCDGEILIAGSNTRVPRWLFMCEWGGCFNVDSFKV
jgi:hypothetical protein